MNREDEQVLETLRHMGAGEEELQRLEKRIHCDLPAKDEQIRILKRLRYEKLENIHGMQQMLDRIDYLIYMIEQEERKNETNE